MVSFLLIFLLLFATNASAIDLNNERLARWHINYGSYLIDVGKYLEALENYETAYEISNVTSIKAEALLSKAMVLATFLDAPEEALKTYRKIKKEFPEKAEIAHFREGLLLFDLGRKEEAKKVLKDYLRRYPRGIFRFQVEALLKQLEFVKLPPKVKVKRPRVRVRICNKAREVLIKGKDVCFLGVCGSFFKVDPGSSIIVNGRSTKKRSITFTSPSFIEVRCGGKRKKLRGDIWIKLKGGRLLVINIVDIEEYLFSVVPSESFPSWPIETLKAQAVAARTYAYYQVLHRKNWDYDLVDNEGDQAYNGVERETPKTTKCVLETEGEILVYQGRPILAMYTANSGGYTADVRAIFDINKPYLIAKPDPESLKGKMAKWKKVFTIDEIERALKRIGINIHGITLIEPAEIGPSGRIVKVVIKARSGRKVLRTRTTLSRALKLPDILMKIKKVDRKFIFEGRGFGHGVGYSQWGAAFMGKKSSYREILSFYYPKTSIVKLW